tara:strand:+ start:84 stop:251 length:168 start_codon:yes stop_codon:yes gene_type:complete
MRKVAALVAGELEAETVKLDFERLAELMTVRVSIYSSSTHNVSFMSGKVSHAAWS